MWKPVTKDGESLELTAETIGDLKEMLKYIPDNYKLSATGVKFGIVMDEDNEIILVDDVQFLEDLIDNQEMEM